MTDSLIRLEQIPPELASAIVKAQTACDSLRRDGRGDKGNYTTSDAIAAEAGRALNENGAAWVRTGIVFEAPGLAESDIGNQSYVGDLVQTWMIVHESGAALVGHSRMPVITSRGRPPDKATAASLTYDVGQVLRGALCMEREGEHSIDRRKDSDDGSEYRHSQRPSAPEPRRQDIGPRCTGKAASVARSIAELIKELAQRTDTHEGVIYRASITEAGIDQTKYGNAAPGKPHMLTVEDGLALKAKLEAKLEATERQPGDDADDPTDGGAP